MAVSGDERRPLPAAFRRLEPGNVHSPRVTPAAAASGIVRVDQSAGTMRKRVAAPRTEAAHTGVGGCPGRDQLVRCRAAADPHAQLALLRVAIVPRESDFRPRLGWSPSTLATGVPRFHGQMQPSGRRKVRAPICRSLLGAGAAKGS
jgi:hypothetical protein